MEILNSIDHKHYVQLEEFMLAHWHHVLVHLWLHRISPICHVCARHQHY
jgi:hypothetical protein